MIVQDISIALIDPHPANPVGRVAETEELLALLENIRTRGLLFPIRVVREPTTGRYTVVAGHRRLWCKRRLDHQDIACIVEDGPVKDGDVLIDQISENVHRAAYKPVEQARLFRLLQEQLKLNNKQMAQRLNYSEASVSMYLGILKLSPALLDAIDDERLAFSTAVEIVKVENPKVRDDLAQRAMDGASRAEIMATILGGKPKAKRLTLRRGDLTVTALEKLTPTAVVRGLEELLKKARKAVTEGHSLESLIPRGQPEEAP
ncbi:MAG: ParB/RepB/Spo0J family partition protein [Fimbriiglobus sp.]